MNGGSQRTERRLLTAKCAKGREKEKDDQGLPFHEFRVFRSGSNLLLILFYPFFSVLSACGKISSVIPHYLHALRILRGSFLYTFYSLCALRDLRGENTLSDLCGLLFKFFFRFFVAVDLESHLE